MEQPVDAAGNGARDLLESAQSSDSIDGAPSRGAAAQNLLFRGAGGLTSLDAIVEEVPVLDRRLLEAGVV
jgi:hypothetical protein